MSPCPESIPKPLLNYLISLSIPQPAVSLSKTDPEFFDPPLNTSSPLSPLIIKARDFIHNHLPPWGANHCYRVYAWGLAVAHVAGWTTSEEAKRLGWDRELWFLVALLHDIGWGEGIEASERTGRLSYELFGGIRARELLLEWGADRDDADEVCEAIVRHAEEAELGSVRLMMALAQLGPTHDFRRVLTPSYIHQNDNEYVCSLYPRLGMVDHVAKFLTTKEIRCKPGCLSTQWADRVIDASKNIESSWGATQEGGKWREKTAETGERKVVE